MYVILSSTDLQFPFRPAPLRFLLFLRPAGKITRLARQPDDKLCYLRWMGRKNYLFNRLIESICLDCKYAYSNARDRRAVLLKVIASRDVCYSEKTG